MRFSSLSLTTAFLVGAALPAAAATLSVPSKAYPTIQKAVSAAKPGDTVLVSAKPKGAVYNEAVTITTPNIVLQGSGNPVIDGTGLGTAVPSPFGFSFTVFPNGIEIRADHVAVRGLTVQNTGGSQFGGASGINAGYLTPDGQTNVGFSDIEISGVTARNNYIGITLNGYAGGSPVYGGTPVSLKGYRLLGDVVTGSTGDGAEIVGASGVLVSGCRFEKNGINGLTAGTRSYLAPLTQNMLIAGNVFASNASDGLNAGGDGLAITANEAAGNGSTGMTVTTSTYNPAVNDPSAPNPPASATALNSIHDNQISGLVITGTQTVSANLLSKNSGYGLSLAAADYSTVSGNVITGTQRTTGYLSNGTASENSDIVGNGTGLYAAGDNNYSTGGYTGSLNITGNVITGSAADGLFLGVASQCTISRNTVTGNGGVGIHLDDAPTYTLYYRSALTAADVRNTVTLNRAVQNTLADARDDADAPANLTYPDGDLSYGDAGYYGPSVNVWTKNTFGTTDPVGLSK